MSLNIDIDDSGIVRVSVRGMVVGLIKSLEVRKMYDDVLPTIQLELVSVDGLPGASSDRDHLNKVLLGYRKLLESHPLVKLRGPHDTLPQGMPAVRPEE